MTSSIGPSIQTIPTSLCSPRVFARKGSSNRWSSVGTFTFSQVIVATARRNWLGYLRGLWLSGLRLGESLVLSWDENAPFYADLTGKYPAFRIQAEAQKRRKDERLSMTQDFAEFLRQTPEEQRQGRVFGIRISIKKAGRIISAIGEKAGVITATGNSTPIEPGADPVTQQENPVNPGV
jgi:hypothetical protein